MFTHHQRILVKPIPLGEGDQAGFIEALQRGARCVVAVDQDPQCIRVSRSNLSAVAESRSPAPEIRTERRELIAWLHKGWRQDPFDVVYFDPPYDRGLYEPCFLALAQGNWLHQDSLVVCEHLSLIHISEPRD